MSVRRRRSKHLSDVCVRICRVIHERRPRGFKWQFMTAFENGIVTVFLKLFKYFEFWTFENCLHTIHVTCDCVKVRSNKKIMETKARSDISARHFYVLVAGVFRSSIGSGARTRITFRRVYSSPGAANPPQAIVCPRGAIPGFIKNAKHPADVCTLGILILLSIKGGRRRINSSLIFRLPFFFADLITEPVRARLEIWFLSPPPLVKNYTAQLAISIVHRVMNPRSSTPL